MHTPIIIDVEASGFGNSSYPIEIGVALPDGERHSWLIRPFDDWTHWDKSAESTHHISRATLIEHGHDPREVSARLNALLDGKTVYSDGWVVDKPWIELLFQRSARSMRFSVSQLEMILREPQMEAWHRVKNQIVVEYKPIRHRASYDAWVIQETYSRTRALDA